MPHGESKLQEFVNFLNSYHQSIQVHCRNGCLPFIDVLICRNSDRSLGRDVYQKPTQINLHKDSHHHSAQTRLFMHISAHRAKVIVHSDHMKAEFELLEQVFKQNGSTRQVGLRELHRSERKAGYLREEDSVKAIAVLPYCSTIAGRMERAPATKG